MAIVSQYDFEERSDQRRLTSWKQIAAYLDVSVRTVQRWERTENLPVLRMPGYRGRVYVDTAALERWKESLKPGQRAAIMTPKNGKQGLLAHFKLILSVIYRKLARFQQVPWLHKKACPGVLVAMHKPAPAATCKRARSKV
jgi:hypothetical protein